MNCPHCNTHIDEHPANACLNDWVAEAMGLPTFPHRYYSRCIAAAKAASDKAGSTVIFAPHSSVRDGCYANRKSDWLVEIIPHKGTTENAIWAYGETEELARCRAAIKARNV